MDDIADLQKQINELHGRIAWLEQREALPQMTEGRVKDIVNKHSHSKGTGTQIQYVTKDDPDGVPVVVASSTGEQTFAYLKYMTVERNSVDWPKDEQEKWVSEYPVPHPHAFTRNVEEVTHE